MELVGGGAGVEQPFPLTLREQLAANAAILKRLAEIDKSLLKHDESLRIIWHKLQPLLQPPPEPPKRRIGFRTEENQ